MGRTSILISWPARAFLRRSGPSIAIGLVALALTACGGGGSSGDSGPNIVPGTDLPDSPAQAARFLTQATFGPSREDTQLLVQVGYTAWIDWQKEVPVSLERPTIEHWHNQGHDVSQNDRLNMWWALAMVRQDQLRQRVAFALSEIFVISDQFGPLNGDAIGMAEYYDILSRDALGDFRQLLEDVTLSPQMGKYLSMLKNRKADLAQNIRPDENYAREIMQLFTIGLNRLNPDGTPQTDVNGDFIPTYDQTIVEAMARVFTGWNFANATSWNWPTENYLPMTAWAQYHDTDAKVLLDGVVLPAGRTAEQDLHDTLDMLANHPNVGPFLGKQLIQRLVTSNPTPGYVQRVASVWADDGTGARGNLFAVVKAILLDDEARHGHLADPTHFGKLKEPLLRQTELWRAFHAISHDHVFYDWNPDSHYGQAPLRSPSVFNFFSPFYQPPGPLLDQGLYAPEFQITTHTLITSGTNEAWSLVMWGNSQNTNDDNNTVEIQIQGERALAATPDALVEDLNQLLMCGSMSDDMRTVVTSLVEDTSNSDGGTQRVLEAIYMIVSSPEFAVQK